MTLSIGSSRSPSGSPEPQGKQPSAHVTAAPPSGRDDEASVLQELEAAMAANPSLRAVTPQPKGEEWEDFDKLMADNPELAKPVPGRKREFYMSKDKWECGHEGEPVMTSIEREGDGEPSLLTNDIRGVCPTCMAKWTKLESRNEEAAVGQGASSRDPFNIGGPPAYAPAKDEESDAFSDDDIVVPRKPRNMPQDILDEWNELAKDNYVTASGKGKDLDHDDKRPGPDWMWAKGDDSDSDSVYEEKRTK